MPRTEAEWIKEMGEDVSIIHSKLREIKEGHVQDIGEVTLNIAIALKEARRLQSDLYRYAQDVFGITREEIDEIHT
jgi:hypothetical protein